MGEEAIHPRENMENGMSKDENTDEVMNQEEEEEEEEDDLEEEISQEEFDALNNQMDELNSALDTIEQKNDNIYSELLKLLQANREIREQLQSGAHDNADQPAAAKQS